MEVNVAQLRRNEGGSESFRFSEIFPSIRLGSEEYVFRKPLEVSLDVINTGKSLLVKGKVQSELAVNCSRCLKDFAYPLNFDFEDEWLPQEIASLEEEDNALIFEKDEFSINDRMLEHILLHFPMKFICSEECKGLCPECGVDLNLMKCNCSNEVIDPRLEILSKWNKGV